MQMRWNEGRENADICVMSAGVRRLGLQIIQIWIYFYIDGFSPHKPKVLWLSGNHIWVEKKIFVTNIYAAVLLYICSQHPKNECLYAMKSAAFSTTVYFVFIYRLKEHIVLQNLAFPWFRLWISFGEEWSICYICDVFLVLFCCFFLCWGWEWFHRFEEKWFQGHGEVMRCLKNESKCIQSLSCRTIHSTGGSAPCGKALRVKVQGRPLLVHREEQVKTPDWVGTRLASGNTNTQIKGSEGFWHLIFQVWGGLIIVQPCVPPPSSLLPGLECPSSQVSILPMSQRTTNVAQKVNNGH